MTISIFHLNDDIALDTRLSLTFGGFKEPGETDEAKPEKAVLAFKALQENQYLLVAEVDTGTPGDELRLLEEAYRLTQNGVESPSWSRLPPKGVEPVEPKVHIVNGKEYGRRSSSMGDIFVINGKAMIVDTFGFAMLGAWPAQDGQA